VVGSILYNSTRPGIQSPMQIFNIGPLELIIILIIMFILLGPKEMVITAQRIGKWIRNLVRSPAWREIMGYSQEIRELPKKIMEDTGLEETLKEVRASTQAAAADINSAVSESMQEVRKSTQEAAAEMNQAVKESVEAARVPEAEHLRLDAGTNQTIAPPMADSSQSIEEQKAASEVQMAASEVQMAAPAVVETTGVEVVPEPAAENTDSVVPAVVEVVQETEAQVPDALVPAVQVAEAEAPKKPRRKRTQTAPEIQAAPTEEAAPLEPAAADQPAAETPKPARRARARKTVVEAKDLDLAAPEVQADLAIQTPIDVKSDLEIQAPLNIQSDLEVQLPLETTPPGNGTETAAPKKRRVKRVESVTEEKPD
jgi:sec-independent protein translocase protein TatB